MKRLVLSFLNLLLLFVVISCTSSVKIIRSDDKNGPVVIYDKKINEVNYSIVIFPSMRNGEYRHLLSVSIITNEQIVNMQDVHLLINGKQVELGDIIRIGGRIEGNDKSMYAQNCYLNDSLVKKITCSSLVQFKIGDTTIELTEYDKAHLKSICY